MKLIIGKNPCTDFQILGETGKDITEELCVRSVSIDVKAGEMTKIVLEVFGEVEAEAEKVDIEFDPKRGAR